MAGLNKVLSATSERIPKSGNPPTAERLSICPLPRLKRGKTRQAANGRRKRNGIASSFSIRAWRILPNNTLRKALNCFCPVPCGRGNIPTGTALNAIRRRLFWARMTGKSCCWTARIRETLSRHRQPLTITTTEQPAAHLLRQIINAPKTAT